MGGPPPKTVLVNVTPVIPDGTACEIDPGNGASNAFVHGGVIKLHGNPSFQVEFQLQAGEAPGLKFNTSDPVNGPIWSSKSQCPTSACQDSQISVVSCTDDTLVINVDPAPPKNAVHVSLNWSTGARFDPIIVNG